MKFKYLSFILCIFAVSCGNKTRQMPAEPEDEFEVKKESVVDPENRQDTVYFGYILGQPTHDITNKLIDEGKFVEDVGYRETFTISKGGVSQKILVDGYAFNLYVSDKKYNALLTLFDTNGQQIHMWQDEKLMSLQIYIQGTDSAPIIEALKEQYGEPNTPPGDNYESFVPFEDMDAFWNISNKAVYLATLGNFMVLVYEDIIAIRDKNNAEAAAKQAEKEHNLEESSKTRL